MPAYTAKTEDQPFAGGVAGGFQPATLKTPPSNWIDDRLRGCGHPQQEEDDRKAGKLEFQQVRYAA